MGRGGGGLTSLVHHWPEQPVPHVFCFCCKMQVVCFVVVFAFFFCSAIVSCHPGQNLNPVLCLMEVCTPVGPWTWPLSPFKLSHNYNNEVVCISAGKKEQIQAGNVGFPFLSFVHFAVNFRLPEVHKKWVAHPKSVRDIHHCSRTSELMGPSYSVSVSGTFGTVVCSESRTETGLHKLFAVLISICTFSSSFFWGSVYFFTLHCVRWEEGEGGTQGASADVREVRLCFIAFLGGQDQYTSSWFCCIFFLLLLLFICFTCPYTGLIILDIVIDRVLHDSAFVLVC